MASYPGTRAVLWLAVALCAATPGCLNLVGLASQAATTYEWPQDLREAAWSDDGRELVLRYEAARRNGGNEQAVVVRRLALGGELLDGLICRAEDVAGRYAAGSIGARSRALLPEMARRVAPGIHEPGEATAGPAAAFHVFEAWDELPAALDRVRRGQTAVFRMRSGFDGRPAQLRGWVIVLAPRDGGRVVAAPLPARESVAPAYVLAWPALFVADVVLTPVTFPGWLMLRKASPEAVFPGAPPIQGAAGGYPQGQPSGR